MRPHGAPGAAGGHEAGALPLLSHALLATWSRSRGSRLTLADYQASGGIRDAIARTAEQAYATLDIAGQELARQLFLRLVHVGEDGREARARLPLRDLPGDASAAAAVLERFVGQRLVTKDRAAAEIAHEALLGAWPRLRAWIDADREDIRLRHFIEVAAQAWAQTGREAAALLRGGQLALAADWMAGEAHRAALSKDARDFVDAAVAEERSQQAAARRRTRRLRQLVAALTVLVLLTIGLAGYAFHQRQLATTARDQAESRTVAVEANQIRPEDPALAAQLSLAAYHISPTAGALASLLESSGAPAAARMFDSDRDVQAVALSPDHRLLAVAAADGTLRLWRCLRARPPGYSPARWRNWGIRIRSTLPRSVPAGRCWPRPAPMGRCGCGTSPSHGTRCCLTGSPGLRTRSTRWHSARAAGCWRPAAPMRRCGCGMSTIPRTRWPRAARWPGRRDTCRR